MAYVNIPNDLSRIKTKTAFGMTTRQLVCFGSAAIVGIPAYFILRPFIGNSAALFLMIGVMIPGFLFAMYERDGLPFEKVAYNFIRARFLWPMVRPYKTTNIYAILTKKGEDQIASGNKNRITTNAR